MKNIDSTIELPGWGRFVLDYPIKSIEMSTDDDKTHPFLIVIHYGIFMRRFRFRTPDECNRAMDILQGAPHEN